MYIHVDTRDLVIVAKKRNNDSNASVQSLIGHLSYLYIIFAASNLTKVLNFLACLNGWVEIKKCVVSK